MYSLEQMQKIATIRDGFCLATDPVTTRTKVTWKCEAGHVWLARAETVVSWGCWCPVCKIDSKLVDATWAQQREKRSKSLRAWRQNNSDKARNRLFQTRYGITLSEYDHLLASQNGGCAICGAPPSGNKRLSVDHDHKTGRVRGLLCQNHNAALGMFQDRPDLLQKAISYLGP